MHSDMLGVVGVMLMEYGEAPLSPSTVPQATAVSGADGVGAMTPESPADAVR